MNPNDYLDSRFIMAQIRVSNRANAICLAENHAVRAWMWVILKVATFAFLFVVLFQYIATLLHLTAPPRKAEDILQSHREREKKMAEQKAKFAAEVAKNVANGQANALQELQ